MNSTQPATRSAQQCFLARNWRAYPKNTLKGFVTIETPAELILHVIAVHEKEGKHWIGIPAKQWQKTDGINAYTPQIEFRDSQARERFRRLALDALDKLLAAQRVVK